MWHSTCNERKYIKTLIRTLNNPGEITPPWRTPQETTTASDNARPHRTLTISLLYQSRNTLITHAGTPRALRQAKSLL